MGTATSFQETAGHAGEHDCGVLYIAFGEQYKKEARRSIASLRRVSPGLEVAVVTDQEWSADPTPDSFVLREPEASYRCKPRYMFEASPFARTLYLDTDTVVALDIRPAFGLLHFYDIGVRFGGPRLNEDCGLELHTQCNSGVVLFRKNDKTEDLFARWLVEYDSAVRRAGARGDPKGLNDQRYLAIAIATSAARPVQLAEYMNFTLFDTITTYSPPVVYHGRLKWMELLHDDIAGRWDTKQDWHVRLWMPNIRGLLPAGVRRSDPLLVAALIARRIYNECRQRVRLAGLSLRGMRS